MRSIEADALVPGRQHQRLDQYFHGIRILGGDLTRQSAADGVVSLFGTLHTSIELDPSPRLSIEEARDAIGRAIDGEPRDQPELVVLPLSDGYHLAYAGQAIVAGEPFNVRVDANTGALLQRYSEFVSEVGTGTGAYGDTKKVSASSISGAFVADDQLRPAEITTYDMKGNIARMNAVFGATLAPSTSDIASSATNVWTDSTVVDAQVRGLYDFIYKRFARQGSTARTCGLRSSRIRSGSRTSGRRPRASSAPITSTRSSADRAAPADAAPRNSAKVRPRDTLAGASKSNRSPPRSTSSRTS